MRAKTKEATCQEASSLARIDPSIAPLVTWDPLALDEKAAEAAAIVDFSISEEQCRRSCEQD
jgi:hypothetical protein